MNKQYYRSASLEGLEYQEKYGLLNYTDSLAPLVIFGMYREEDFAVLNGHEGEVTVVWQGADAKQLPEEWARYMRERADEKRNIRHIAISHWIFDSLTSHWLAPEMKYLSATVASPELANCPNGDFVHFYGSVSGADNAKYLGADLIPEIISKTGIPIITTAFGMFDKPALYDIYRKCFLHLRLTSYDGCPNSNLEMGLMGRRSVFNGKGMPGSIPWIDVNHVCDIILHEYDNRKKDNSRVSQEVLNFINQNTL